VTGSINSPGGMILKKRDRWQTLNLESATIAKKNT
jgi:hypothetical protein